MKIVQRKRRVKGQPVTPRFEPVDISMECIELDGHQFTFKANRRGKYYGDSYWTLLRDGKPFATVICDSSRGWEGVSDTSPSKGIHVSNNDPLRNTSMESLAYIVDKLHRHDERFEDFISQILSN